MTITEYRRRVRELFEAGTPTDAQWDEMTQAVLRMSETNQQEFTEEIDIAVGAKDTDERE